MDAIRVGTLTLLIEMITEDLSMRHRFTSSLSLIGAVAVLISLLASCRLSFARESVQTLPVPPLQNAPWSPPTGDSAKPFPDTLLSATEVLFQQGMADPRGGEYRKITVTIGDVWGGGGNTVETHGWLLPSEPGGKQLAVCWNGLVYPVVSVKGTANLASDMNALLKQQEEQRRKSTQSLDYTLMLTHATPESSSVSTSYPALIKVVYLLRLGEYQLAQKIYDLWLAGTPPNHNSNTQTRNDPYLHLAMQWAWSAYDRAICAHMRGDDALALADCSLLTRIQPLIEAEAIQRGFKKQRFNSTDEEKLQEIAFLNNVPELKQDAERRVSESSRHILSLEEIKKLPQSERIAELIRSLDQVKERQWGQPGGVSLGSDPICMALVSEGDAAVEPLLDAMEKDKRLTRSVSFHRDFFTNRNLLTVQSAAFAAFVGITKVSLFAADKPSISAIRTWWEKNKVLAPTDRWFAQLADESTLDANRWQEGASRILMRTNVDIVGSWISTASIEPGKTAPAFRGEPLRTRQNPSVSDLLQKRALQLSEPIEGRWGFDFAKGANFALMLYEWDPAGPQTLSTLQKVMHRCLEFQAKLKKDEGSSEQYQLSGRIARMTWARVALGDTAAADEYSFWLQSVSPRYLGFETLSSLLALWRTPEEPALRRVSEKLFLPTAAPTAWNQLFLPREQGGDYNAGTLLHTGMICVPAFRTLVMRSLTDRTQVGMVTQKGNDENTRQYQWNDGSSSGATPQTKGNWKSIPMRRCDRCAIELQPVAGVPRFDPLASASERDRQCASILAFLTRYGDTLHLKEDFPTTLYGYGTGNGEIIPILPLLSVPATVKDVNENRAVFTLNNPAARIVSDLPIALPFEAQWSSDPNANTAIQAGGKRVPWSRGWVYQAEEIYEGGKWKRYYGYVGPHSISKVPAEEISITDNRLPRKPVANK